jgi:hypothetical protein
MIFNKARGIDVPFGTVTTVDDYGTVTGYKPGHPATDRGTTVVEAADYSRKTGLSDAYGKRHKIAAYMELDPGNMTNLFYAVYLGMAVGIGWRLPSIADEQFAEGKPWDFTGQDTGTGHYTPFTHHSKQWDYVISWGKRIRVKRGKGGIGSSYCDEAIVYVTQENLVNQKSPEGFDYEQLMEFLGSLRSA